MHAGTSFKSEHPGGVQMAMADGSVQSPCQRQRQRGRQSQKAPHLDFVIHVNRLQQVIVQDARRLERRQNL